MNPYLAIIALLLVVILLDRKQIRSLTRDVRYWEGCWYRKGKQKR